MHEFSEKVLVERDAFVPGHRTRMVDAAMLQRADLVLTAAREHRAVVVRLLPAAIGRTFTVEQFARLAGAVPAVESGDPGELGRELLAEAKAARAQLQPVPPEQDDLPDPMGWPIEKFEECGEALERCIASMLSPLRLLP